MRKFLEEYLSRKRIDLDTLIIVNRATISVDSLVDLMEDSDEEDQWIIK